MLEKLERKLFTMILKQLLLVLTLKTEKLNIYIRLLLSLFLEQPFFYSSPVFAYPTIDW